MLSRVDVVSDLNGTTLVSFPLADAKGEEDYIITNIDGLAPVKSNISVIDYATDPGGFYTNAHVGVRTIGIDIKLRSNTAKTPKQNRDSLFRWFDIGNTIWLQFHDTERDPIRIKGMVESNDFNPFTRDPSNRISIVCLDPYFRDSGRKTLTGFTNEPINIWGHSNGPTPIQVTTTLDKKVDRVRIWVGPNEGLMVDTSSLAVGQKVWLSTEPGNKFVRTGSSGSWSNSMHLLYSGGLSTTFGDVNTANINVRTDTSARNPVEISFIPRWVSI